MPAEAPFQMAVEAPHDSVRLIRIAGNLDRAAAASLLRLIDAQMAGPAVRERRLTDLLLDIDGVRSFGPGGLETVRHARHSTSTHGVRIHLTGCSGRFHLLPLRARQLLGEFPTFPSVEVALAELARTTATAMVTLPATTPTTRADTPTPPASPPDQHRRLAQRHDGPGDLHPATRTSTGSAPHTMGLPTPRGPAEEPRPLRSPPPAPGDSLQRGDRGRHTTEPRGDR